MILNCQVWTNPIGINDLQASGVMFCVAMLLDGLFTVAQMGQDPQQLSRLGSGVLQVFNLYHPEYGPLVAHRNMDAPIALRVS
jgi:hypothetical protein